MLDPDSTKSIENGIVGSICAAVLRLPSSGKYPWMLHPQGTLPKGRFSWRTLALEIGSLPLCCRTSGGRLSTSAQSSPGVRSCSSSTEAIGEPTATGSWSALPGITKSSRIAVSELLASASIRRVAMLLWWTNSISPSTSLATHGGNS